MTQTPRESLEQRIETVLTDFTEQMDELEATIAGTPTTAEMMKLDAVYSQTTAEILAAHESEKRAYAVEVLRGLLKFKVTAINPSMPGGFEGVLPGDIAAAIKRLTGDTK